MKLRIAIVLVALIPVFFAMQNCSNGGSATFEEGASSVGLNNQNGGGPGHGVLHGSCVNSSGVTCYESYGLDSIIDTVRDVCTSSAPSGTTNTWTDDGHCGPAYSYRCDTTSAYADGSPAGVMNYTVSANASLMQQSCSAGGGRFSANPNTTN